MERILIIGCPGAGKSTFARRLRELTGLPLYYLDRIFHRADRTTVTQEEFDAALQQILETDRWIIDGNYLRTLETRLKECDAVFFLDYPQELCLEGAASRVGTVREDMPWVETEFDPEFRQYILDFSRDQLPQIYELLEMYKKDRKIFIFHSREDADEWLRKGCQKGESMEKEKSCGAVVFTRDDEGSIRYVLVEQRSGRFCFPKGHVEAGETEHQTALREIWEETGLRPVIIPGFRETETYEVAKKPGTMKDVIYFIAEYTGQTIDPPLTDEIRDVRLCTYEEALALLPTDSRKEILTGADHFLREGKQIYIRTASIDDLDAVTAVEAECFPPAEAASREDFAERLQVYPDHFWLMFDGQRLISFVDGFCTDEPDLTDEMFAKAEMHNENGAWQMIFGVNTIPSERKKGYAGALIRRAIVDAREQGRKGLALTCKKEKIVWYAKFGFVNEELSESVHGGVPWYQMRLTFQ